jgi:excisionase family DNA binding protein
MPTTTSDGLVLDPKITSTHLPATQIFLVTTKQAAEILQVSERTIWNLITGGHLKPVKIGRATRLLSDELTEFARVGTVEIARAFVVEKLAE